MITSILSFFIKIGFGGVVDKAINHLEKRAELENDKERLRSQTTVELAKQAVIETQVMADFNKSKLGHNAFWYMTGGFIFMLFTHFAAVTLYGLFWHKNGLWPQNWDIAAYPHPLDEWAGIMITWLFFVGTGVGAVKVLKK